MVDTSTWTPSTATDTIWTTPWTPGGEGPHRIEATLDDWAGGTYTDSLSLIIDTQPPQVAISTAVFTTTHLAGGQVTVAGTADDDNGLSRVEVQARGVWRPAVFDSGAWTATWVPDLGAQPDGETVSLTARATDRAGWKAVTTRDILVDVKAPPPVDLALSYEDGGGTIPITEIGTTLREPGGTLRMAWTASSDGSGLAGYRAGFTAIDAGGTPTTAWTTVVPGGVRQASTAPGEAQKVTASLGSRDAYGNTSWQEFGPVYVDSPLTPDYTPLDDPEGTYHGWMEGGCSLLGTDRRLSRIASERAMLHGEQSLYATWDSRALRLAWNGANWSADGDLFIYLDTVPGGSAKAFNPYLEAGTLSETAGTPEAPVVTLAGDPPTAVGTGEMLADYGVWVEDAQTAWLLTWNGTAWTTSPMLAGTQFRYQPSADGGLTDLYLPFELLGIADPAQASPKLLAFASEEGALRLWAVLPDANPVTSLLATGRLSYVLEAASVPLVQFYQWPSLGAGMCPNGTGALAAGQTPYDDSEVQARLTADPAGIVYHYLGDHLFPWADYLLGEKPPDFTGLLSLLGRNQSFVQDGQTLNYTLQVQNSGQETARDVTARVWSGGALILPGGAPDPAEGHRYFQEVAIGDLAPGERTIGHLPGPRRPRLGPAAVRRRAWWPIPTARASASYTCAGRCSRSEIVDQAHPPTGDPLERIWADHRVDFQAPRFAGISQSGLRISPGGAELARLRLRRQRRAAPHPSRSGVPSGQTISGLSQPLPGQRYLAVRLESDRGQWWRPAGRRPGLPGTPASHRWRRTDR